VRADAPRYDRASDGTLVVGTVPANPGVYRVPGVVGIDAPWQSDDTSYRVLRQMRLNSPVGIADRLPDELRAAPGSAIRIRVAGVTGSTKPSRERVRLVAEQVAADTGLDV